MTNEQVTGVVGCSIAIGMTIVAAILNGLALMQLWAWFIVTTLNAPELSLPAAIGLMTTVRVFFKVSKPTSDDQVYNILMMFVQPIMALIVGWIVFQFMR